MQKIYFPAQYKKKLIEGKKNTTIRVGKELKNILKVKPIVHVLTLGKIGVLMF